ncbi:MAG TPA: polysaccharide biosynthesis/export family protein [Candidatus Sulfotelmatobacter sp.]|jgi:polysaccharide export outer membrane protein
MKNQTTFSAAALAMSMLCGSLTAAWGQNQNSTAVAPSKEYAKLVTGNAGSTGSVLAATTGKEHYLIGNEDVLAINVWKEPDVSRLVPVRSDGKISLPLLGEVQAAGKSPKELESDIAKGLRDYISEPEVTVIVQESKSRRFSILGQVQRPGSYLLSGEMRVLDAIAIAGGFRDFAKVKSIRVLRLEADGKQSSLPFNYKDVIKGTNPGQNVELEPKDTIYIP